MLISKYMLLSIYLSRLLNQPISRRQMAEILPIRLQTTINQSINQSINQLIIAQRCDTEISDIHRK